MTTIDMSEQGETSTNERVELSDEQQEVINTVLAGRNIFITGAAGVGKSFVLKEAIKILPPESTYVTASTGVAACNISGTTLHSFAGIGLGNAPYEELLKRATKRFNLDKWLKCRALVIDEISMIDGELFSKVENIARTIKGNERPFGGIQLVLCGDFLQLPPVQKEKAKKFCFEVPAWERCVLKTMVLKKVFRQKDDHFIGILSRVRLGEMNLKDKADLLKCHFTKKIFDDKIHATKLFPHRISCEQVNNNELNALPGESKVYECTDGGKPEFMEQMDKYSRFPKILTLKVGAQVMLLKNLLVADRLVNGSRGVVIGFVGAKEQALKNIKTDVPEVNDFYEQLAKPGQLSEQQYPLVRFTNGIEKLIQIETSSIEVAGREVAFRKQIPLALAWAVSVHKAQGMTLERVELSLKNVFECGQAYVALSRCTALEGLRLDDFSQDKVRAHPTVLSYYRKLEEKVRENTIEQSNSQIYHLVPEKWSDNVRNSEVDQNSTFSIFRNRRSGQIQTNAEAPSLNAVTQVGNKLFKMKTEKSTIGGHSKSTKVRKSVKRKNNTFFSNVKQTRIDLERYCAKEKRSQVANSNRENCINSSSHSDLILID